MSVLTAAELEQLTGYKQHRRQLRWLAERLKLNPPTRMDGLPLLTQAQVEAALAGQAPRRTAGPNWSKIAA